MNDHPVIYAELKYNPEPKARKLLGPTRTRWQPWTVWIWVKGNNENLFKGSERWTNKQEAIDAVNLAHGPESIVYLRQPEAGDLLIRHPEPWPAA